MFPGCNAGEKISTEEDIEKLGEFIRTIEGYVKKGIWNPQQHDEMMAMIGKTESLFDNIIAEYTTMTGIPSVQQAHIVSNLQESLHHVRHNLPSSPASPEHTDSQKAGRKVVIYTTPACPYCHRTKEYLSRKGVSYIEYNVAQDRDKAREMIQKAGQMRVPVITVDDEVIVGFNQSRLDSLLS